MIDQVDFYTGFEGEGEVSFICQSDEKKYSIVFTQPGLYPRFAYSLYASKELT